MLLCISVYVYTTRLAADLESFFLTHPDDAANDDEKIQHITFVTVWCLCVDPHHTSYHIRTVSPNHEDY